MLSLVKNDSSHTAKIFDWTLISPSTICLFMKSLTSLRDNMSYACQKQSLFESGDMIVI